MIRIASGASLFVAIQLLAQSSHWRSDWHFEKADPASGKMQIEISAKSFDQTADGKIKYLHNMTAKIYNANGGFREISSTEAVADTNRATLAYGPGLKTIISLKNP
jgi:hypothetical protein